MFILTKKGLQHLADPYITDSSVMAYGNWQSFNAPASRCLLVLDDSHLQILSLNLFSTKVLYTQTIPLAELEAIQLKQYVATATFHFAYAKQGYRFQLPLTILPLGNGQAAFLTRCQALVE